MPNQGISFYILRPRDDIYSHGVEAQRRPQGIQGAPVRSFDRVDLPILAKGESLREDRRALRRAERLQLRYAQETSS